MSSHLNNLNFKRKKKIKYDIPLGHEVEGTHAP